ncbi:hypothetical protein [Actinomadura violacea]|uniref:Uncharacterized protein n=1 Tax=Actinomadura violacea TaxID=2819934 RepID=A0ABS3S4I6_9ACTN|nr:hypothetical protein [Actinomadura violacea]MBO2463877.1 hypothetical protein [Actinomadura violacea]
MTSAPPVTVTGHGGGFPCVWNPTRERPDTPKVDRAEMDALVIATLKGSVRNSEPADIIGARTAAEDVAALRAEVKEHKDRLIEIADDYGEDRITREQRATAAPPSAAASLKPHRPALRPSPRTRTPPPSWLAPPISTPQA